MESERFDRIIRFLAGGTSRRAALSTLAAGTVGAALGLSQVGLESNLNGVEAKKKKKKTICHCTTNDPVSCSTIRVSKKARKQHLQHHCDYDGACEPKKVGTCTPPAPPFSGCAQDDECAEGLVCRNRVCVAGCREDVDCGEGFVCQNGGCACPSGRTLCGDVCADLATDPDNCGECDRACAGGDVCSNGFTCQAAACLAVSEVENEVKLADDGGLRLIAATSGPNPPYVYGALGFDVPDGTNFADILTMDSDFDFISGACGAGTPRFCVRFEGRDDCACAQFPASSGCNVADAAGNTGNLIGNDTPGIWFGLCAPGPVINTYAEALTEYGAETISELFLVADSSNGTQVVIVNPCVTVA